MTSYYQCLARLNNSIIQDYSKYRISHDLPDELHLLSNITSTNNMNLSNFYNTFMYPLLSNISITYDIPYVNLSNNLIGDNITLNLNDVKTCEKPWNFINRNVLICLWRIVYWASQVLTWLIIPMMQSYSKAGNFTVFGKLKMALYENVVWYGTYIVIFVLISIYVALKPNLHIDSTKLLLIISSASNTWGLILLVLLLGYGLIQVPRGVWYYSAFVGGAANSKLMRCFYKAAIVYPLKQESQESLEEIIEEIEQLSMTVPESHPIRPKIEILIEKLPENYRSKILSATRNKAENSTRLQSALEFDPPNPKTLIKIHKRLINGLTNHYRTQMQWESILETVRDLSRAQRGDKNFDSTLSGMDSDFYAYVDASAHKRPIQESGHRVTGMERCLNFRFSRAIVTLVRLYVRPCIYKLLAVSFCLLSLALIWSELFMFKRNFPILSIFAIFFRLAKTHLHNYVLVEVVSISTLTYLSLCAYFTIFKLRIFDLYCLLPNHHTDEYSLLFAGMLLSRLTSPLCLNFLSLIHMDQGYAVSSTIDNMKGPDDGQPIDTAFIQVMGRLNLIPFIGQGFNVYFPMLIFVLCLANYFDLIQKLGRSVGYNKLTTGDFNRYYALSNLKTRVENGTIQNGGKYNIGKNSGDNTAALDDDDVDGKDMGARIGAMVEEGKLLLKREFRNRYLVTHDYKDLTGNKSADRKSKNHLLSTEILRKKYGGISTNREEDGNYENYSDTFTDRNSIIARPNGENSFYSNVPLYSSREDLLPKASQPSLYRRLKDTILESGNADKLKGMLSSNFSAFKNKFANPAERANFGHNNRDSADTPNSSNSADNAANSSKLREEKRREEKRREEKRREKRREDDGRLTDSD
ncbi:unnamed protein product [Gordionus sp. m RMFG-2023]